MNYQTLPAAVLLLALVSVAPAPAFAKRAIDDNDTVTLRGNVHPQARAEYEVGPSDPNLPMERMVLTLRVAPGKQADLDKLLAEQHDEANANFHRWITPEEYKSRFAPGQEDLDAVTSWLTSHGFTVDEISKGGTTINFTGSAGAVERALHTRIKDYLVDGKLRHANAVDPAIPRGLADVVDGVVSLHNFPRKAMHAPARPVSQDVLQPEATFGSSHYLSPADFATIYNLNPLYSAGFDGTGQSIAIVARSHPSSTNWTSFRSKMGLPANTVQVIVNGADPGALGGGEDNEADLDVEWSGAVAKNATIKFVVSKSTTTDGVDLSAQYIVNNNLAPVMSTSFGLCESFMGTSENAFYNNLWQQAAAQGITSFVSTGDSGAAGCDASSATSGIYGRAVSGLSTTPYNVAVGGTQFNDGGGGYWNSSNTSALGSALSYIPEVAWNESGSVSGGSSLLSTGGGASSVYSKPSWQIAPGVPADGMRDVPDVSLTAAGHDGYLVCSLGICSQNSFYVMSGTSASSPAFAGIMALVVQKTGQRQGNANTRLYQLGNAQYASGGAAVFHDTTSGNNTVPGVTGFATTAGYDVVTGLGSVDANALVNNWTPQTPLALNTNSVGNATVGVAYSSTLAATGGTPPYSWSVMTGSLPAGLSLGASSGIISGTPTGSGVFSFSVKVSDSVGGSVTKNFSEAVSATACGNAPVLVGAAYYPDFASAYPLVADNGTIEFQALDFNADFVLDRNVTVKLTGGYDCAYSGNAAMTGLLGKLQLKSGLAKVDKLKLK